jgi:hypothetical protein
MWTDWAAWLMVSRCCVSSDAEVRADVVRMRFPEMFFRIVATAIWDGTLALHSAALTAIPIRAFMSSVSTLGSRQGIMTSWGRERGFLAVSQVMGVGLVLVAVEVGNSVCAAGAPIHGFRAEVGVLRAGALGGTSMLWCQSLSLVAWQRIFQYSTSA